MKVRTLQWLANLAIFGGFAVYLFSLTNPDAWQLKLGGYVIWVLCVGGRVALIRRGNRWRMQELWTLADELGYGPAKLKQLAGRYSLLDWAASQPQRLQFVPQARVCLRVLVLLQSEQKRRLRDADVAPEIVGALSGLEN
ncbi:hypothetical protein [Lacticaseibacillus sp. GG6-2]